MQTYLFSSKRGGVGKTNLAHLFALGSAWKRATSKSQAFKPYFVHTDDRDPLETMKRPYFYYDARDPELLKKIHESASEKEGVMAIDSGGNREIYDQWLGKSVSLVLIPFIMDYDSVLVAKKHRDMLVESGASNVKFIANRYPSSERERNYVQKYIDMVEPDEIVAYVADVRSVRKLLEPDTEDFKTPDTKINNVARKLFKDINDYIDSL